MKKLTDDRRTYLRGAYLDRIVEVAQFYIATHSYFIDSDFKSFIADEFSYLTELTDEEQQYLRDQVGLQSLARIATSRARDRKEIFGRLIADNPDVVIHDADFAFDIGWIDLVKDAVARMRTYPKSWRVRLDGGKEKFGCCVLFVSFDIHARGCMSEVERMREEIRLRSLGVCDICGEQGRLRIGQWAKTVCDRHAAVLGEMREDDGKWADPWRWHEEQPLEDHIAATSSSVADVQAGLDDEYPPEAAEVLKDLVPVRKRPRDHIADFMPQTAISRQIAADIDKKFGRKADLLVELIGQIELAVVAAMSVADDDVDFWLYTEVGRWQGVQPLSEDDRQFLFRYLRSLAVDERGRRDRRRDGTESLQRFLAAHPDLVAEAAALGGRERELLDAYAGDLTDSAQGRVVKEEYLDGYIRDEIALWPDVLELSDDDREWLRSWLRKLIDAEYERIRIKQEDERNND